MSNHSPKDLESANLQWRDDQPISAQFDDVYYSTDDGLAESRYVFLAGNQLPQRWQSLAAPIEGDKNSDSSTCPNEPKNGVFTIAETGFGTGLNFLAAVDLWLETAPADHQLHFVSVEKYPLTRPQLEKSLAHWAELESLSRPLIESYPPLVSGLHTLWLYDGRVRLTLIFDDAIEGFSELLLSKHPAFEKYPYSRVDAWFLDGFAPSKNPDLWSPELFKRMAQLSGQNTSYATFTVARLVRDGLMDAGFSHEKLPGFGRKRNMLRGQFHLQPVDNPPPDWTPPKVLRNSHYESTWQLNLTNNVSAAKKALIIGAGIAGCTTAAALKRRGWDITLIDKHGLPGQEASGNPQGILYPKLSVENSPLSRFSLSSLCYAMAFYKAYWAADPATENRGKNCGVLVLPESEKDADHFREINKRFAQSSSLVQLVEKADVSAVCGVELEQELGLWFPQLGWVCPPLVCAEISGGIPLVQAEVHSLERDEDTQSWQLLDSAGRVIASAPHVVIASSNQSRQFNQCDHLPLRPVRGQISTLEGSEQSRKLRSVICGAGYLAPVTDAHHTLGATFTVDDQSADVRLQDHARNLETLAKTDSALPGLWQHLNPEHWQGRAAVRCTTPDYLPIAGPVPNVTEMKKAFADYRRNAKADIPLPGAYLPGLWLNCGHGSRGLTYGPMVAELLASQMNSELLPLPRSLLAFLNPARFIIRDIKRGH